LKYRLKLLKRVNAISGMTIESAPNKNLKICHAASDNCVNLSMTDSNNFDITPNTPTGMMTIKSASSSLPMAKFDFAQNNVYFGGSNIDSSPMYVSGNQVYLDKDRVKIKLTDSVNMNFNTMMTQNNRMKLAMEAMNSAIWQSSSNIEVLAQYRLTNTWASASSPITNNLQITLIPLYNIVSGTELYVELSISELGVTGITDGISMTSTPNIASVQKDVKDGNKLKITITAPSGMDKDKAIFFTLATTTNKFTLVTSPTATTQNVIAGSGTTIARRNVYPADYPPILSQNAINNIYS
jgi:hypothetical protein